MSYRVDATAPEQVSSEKRTELRKMAWQRNNGYWVPALVLLVIAIPSLGQPLALVVLLVAAILFAIAFHRVDAYCSSEVSRAQKWNNEWAVIEAQQRTDEANEKLCDIIAKEETIRKEISAAGASLVRARAEFKNRVFALFWQHVERAASSLAQAARSRHALPAIIEQYHAILQSRSHTFPGSPIDLRALPAQRSQEAELDAVIRAGLADDQAATIWESRRRRSGEGAYTEEAIRRL